MTVLIRCPLPSCNKMTGWQYPNFEWARVHVPGVPSRCLLVERYKDEYRALMTRGDSLCPDPILHVNQFLMSRGQPVIPMSVLQSSGDPESGQTEDD